MSEYHHLSKLIENLLFLARSEHGQITLEKEIVNAEAVLLNICDYYQAMAHENNIALTCTGNTNIYVDPTHFKRAMSNLISNSLKYTPPHGKVTINMESFN